MKLAVLYSGGKDSNYSLWIASKENEISCLINLKSENEYSYMFQKTGTDIVKYQSEALEIPLIQFETKGEKEHELKDLKKAIKLAIEKYKISGVVSGAIKSTYQASRVQKICNELDIWCFNPIWQIDEKKYLDELIKNKFDIRIVKIASYPFDKKWLGRKLDENYKKDIEKIDEKMPLSYVGEGGETESIVLDSPCFKKKIEIETSIKMESENCGDLIFERVKLVEK
ncbi:MAG: diphthine--ammonia ligase [Nanoarchaeota archaeon]